MQEYERYLLDYPIQNALTQPIRAAAAKQNLVEYLSLWAGQSAYLSKGLNAGKLIKQLDLEVKKFLNNLAKNINKEI